MKKKILPILLVVLSLAFIFFTVAEKVSYSKLSFEEKILQEMNFDQILDETSVDNIILLKEAEEGYFCVATSSEEELVNFGYIKEKNDKLEFAGKSFSSIPMIVHNEDPTAYLKTKILNFSDKNFYYGCFQHRDGLQLTVNDSEAEIHNFTLNYRGEEFNMDFWFVCSEKEPTVTLK